MGELVERVDEQDRVVGVVDRAEAIRRRWLHRIAVTLCRDSRGRYLVMWRPLDADRAPGQATLMCGGAVDPGESYEAAAARELQEELGVVAPVRFLFKYLCLNSTSPIWMSVHEAVISSEITADPREVARYAWIDEAEVGRRIEEPDFGQHVRDVFQRYLDS